MKKISTTSLLLLILLCGAVLRMWDLFFIPLTHDEFSALGRTHFNSFSELIARGVKIDGHPALIQVFLAYWVKLGGDSAVWIKMPFLLMGIACIYLVFYIGKMLFSTTTGLLSAAFMAVIQYQIAFSQMARPYISGEFFVLCMFICWYRFLVLKETQHRTMLIAGYILFASLSSYNHHFSLLMVAMLWLCGLLYQQSLKTTLIYIGYGVAIFALYIPHLPIFFYQLSIGGVGGWLGKPTPQFLFDLFFYILHFSWPFLLLVLAMSVYGFATRKTSLDWKIIVVLSLLFFLPFLIGYFYSVYVNPVLQGSVLIFGFPFFLIVFFSGFEELAMPRKLAGVLTLLIMGSVTLVYGRDHYSCTYNSPYRAFLLDYNHYKVEKKSVAGVIDSELYIYPYYNTHLGVDTAYHKVFKKNPSKGLVEYLERNSDKEYCYVGSMINFDQSTASVVRLYFPYLVQQHNYFTGTGYLFAKKQSGVTSSLSTLDLSADVQNWRNVNKANIESVDGKSVYSLIDEWGPGYFSRVDSMKLKGGEDLDFLVELRSSDTANSVVLVTEFKAPGMEPLWHGKEAHLTASTSAVFHSTHVPELKDSMTVALFVWNKGKKNVVIENATISTRTGNPRCFCAIMPIRE